MRPVNAISPWDLSAQAAQATRLRNSGDQRAQFEDAAKGFENLMVRKWIEVARRSSLEQKEGASASYQAMADDQLAFLMTRQGGFGIARQLLDQMMVQIKGRVADPSSAGVTAGAKAVAGDVVSGQLTPTHQKAVSSSDDTR